MRLLPLATLKVSFTNAGAPPDLCEPAAQGGYLEADNQLIRVKVSDQGQIIWGFDNTSFLYRVRVGADSQTLTLQSSPVDALHRPRKGQTVEVLLSAARLHNGEYVAEADGVVTTLSTDYDQDTKTV